MGTVDPDKLWFNTPDTATLCRGGGNGTNHPSQLYALKKYWKDGMTILDYGCGSATTWEAIVQDGTIHGKYLGLDIIPKNVEWCKENYPDGDFKVNSLIHEIDMPDKTWDVVYSRHVVDHMESFEKAMDEHKRVAKKLVIVMLWVPFSTGDKHEIKNIDYRHNGGILYKDEYTNQYSKKKVLEYLENDPKWKLLELTEELGTEVSGHDTVIVLGRK